MTPRAGLIFTRIVRGARPSAQALLGGARVPSHTQTCTGLHRSTPAGDNSSTHEFSHTRNDAPAYSVAPLRGTTRTRRPTQKGPGSSWVCSQEFHPVLPTGFATPIRPKRRNRPGALDSFENKGIGTPAQTLSSQGARGRQTRPPAGFCFFFLFSPSPISSSLPPPQDPDITGDPQR
mgnify:CR=1 FL=1